ncbi:MAG TPA: class I SAM-dependent methyltransferase [Methanoregula sp.]|nr:class I SAM-dependent methyltransferase [Methanoregula sp.]
MTRRTGPALSPGSAETDRPDAFFAERKLPLQIERAIEEYITKKAGKNWDDPAVLGKLRRAIAAQKDEYWKPAGRRNVRYVKGYSVLGYLAYHFPVYFMQAEHLLAMLARDGLLKPSMNILDAGTGPGVVPLAIADFYSRRENAKATVHSIERSGEHREAFLFLRERCTAKGANAGVKPPIAMDITGPELSKVPGKIDLMTFSNVLNELPGDSPETGARIVSALAGRLSPDGSILITEPADEENATRMRSLTIALVKRGFSVFSPCSFLWGTVCDAPRCWSFETAPPIRPTRLMEVLAQDAEGFRYVNTDIKYSYAVLRKDGLTKQECSLPADSKFLRLGKIHLHAGKRVNVAVAKMSGELGDHASHVIKICDGTAKAPVYAVVPSYHITPENELITTAPYGSVLEIRGVLVRYNRAHDAYNLLVNRNTTVSRPEMR